MRTLFLNLPSPPGIDVARDFLGYGVGTPSTRTKYGHSGHVIPPIVEAYAAAMLEEGGFEVNVLDGQVRNLDLPQLFEEVENRRPDVIVSRLSLPSLRTDLALLAKIKHALQNVILVGWGTICTVEPRKVLGESELDVAIQGELEFTILDTIQILEQGGKLHDVKGISFKEGGDFVLTEQRPVARDLDVLPMPAYHLLDMERYVMKESRFFPAMQKENRLIRFFSVLSSRGCPFSCMYCPYPIAFGKVWRGRSPRKTADEIEYLAEKYDIQAIWFRDQTFSMDINRAIGICEEITERGLDIHWTCETRADKLPRELLKKMKNAGCVWVNIGVESGDPDLLRDLAKISYTTATIEQAFRIAKEEGILRRAFVLVGLPGESWRTIQNTRRLIQRINPDALVVDIVTPYPGTLLYEMAERNNWLTTKDWSRYTTVDPVMSLKGFDAEDMKSARRYLLDQIQSRQKIENIISSIREGRFQDASMELGSAILGLPRNLWRLYNMVRSELKQNHDNGGPDG